MTLFPSLLRNQNLMCVCVCVCGCVCRHIHTNNHTRRPCTPNKQWLMPQAKNGNLQQARLCRLVTGEPPASTVGVGAGVEVWVCTCPLPTTGRLFRSAQFAVPLPLAVCFGYVLGLWQSMLLCNHCCLEVSHGLAGTSPVAPHRHPGDQMGSRKANLAKNREILLYDIIKRKGQMEHTTSKRDQLLDLTT